MKAKFNLVAGLGAPAIVGLMFSLSMFILSYSIYSMVIAFIFFYAFTGVLILIIFMSDLSTDSAYASSMIHDIVGSWRNFYSSIDSLDDGEPLNVKHLKSLVPVPENPFKDNVLLKQLGFYPDLPQGWKGHEAKLLRAADDTISAEDIRDLDSLLRLQEAQAEKEGKYKLEIELGLARLWLSAH